MKKITALVLSLTFFLLIPIRAGDVHGKKITGAAATVQLSTTSTPVKWIQIIAPSGNSANVFWGDCSVTSSANGTILPAGAGQFLPPPAQGGYDLAQVCVYIANADLLYVGYEGQ